MSTTPKLCINCVHYRPAKADRFPHRCSHPENGIDLVTGGPVFFDCETMRRDNRSCGPQGAQFSPAALDYTDDLPPSQTLQPGADKPVDFTPGGTNAIEAAAITALKHRAKTGILSAVLRPHEKTKDILAFWQAYHKALNDLDTGAGQKLADKDEMLGGYQVPGILRTAASVLNDDAYLLPRGEIKDLLTQGGVQLPADTVTGGYFVTTHEFEDGAVVAVDLHDEQAVARVDAGDGSGGGHGALLGDAAIVAEGGAA